MAILYRNSDGKDVTHTSYSSRASFKRCPREFQLTRIHGWWSKENRAAPLFGKCIEAGLQAFEENDRAPGFGVKVFRKHWEDVKLMPEFPTLLYTATEVSWEQLLKSGIDMMLLYEVRVPRLPIVKPLFQQKLRKTIFPGSNLAMLENVAILDILSFPRWDHPMLSKLEILADGTIVGAEDGGNYKPLEGGGVQADGVRPLIIDVKTAGKDFPSELIALDPQLAEYAWQTRIPDIGFLTFVKSGHGFKRGSRITTLRACGALWAGWEGYVLE